jgi:hypothetical protein
MTLHHDPDASKDAAQTLAFATFTVTGDQVIPDIWTAYFGVDPDIAITKGSAFISPSGRISRLPGRTGVWGITSKNNVRDDLLDPHLRFLISRLMLPRNDLIAKLQKDHALMRILCYWADYAGNRRPTIGADISAVISSCGGTIEIDVYPQQHSFNAEDGDDDVLV